MSASTRLCFNKHAVSKAMMYLAFDYPFRQLKVKKIFGLVPERNHQARKFNLKLGFKIEYLADDVFNHDGWRQRHVSYVDDQG